MSLELKKSYVFESKDRQRINLLMYESDDCNYYWLWFLTIAHTCWIKNETHDVLKRFLFIVFLQISIEIHSNQNMIIIES